MIFKNRVTGPWDHKDSVYAKKVFKKFQKISCLCTFNKKAIIRRTTFYYFLLLYTGSGLAEMKGGGDGKCLVLEKTYFLSFLVK
jgi:hypothetical protein